MTFASKQDLISVVSSCLDKEISKLSIWHHEEMAKLTTWHQTEIEKIQSDHQEEINKIKKDHQEEIQKINIDMDRLKGKLSQFAQTDDTNKLQKRTIASLTYEIATMQATITNLEKRLKLKESVPLTEEREAPVKEVAPVKEPPVKEAPVKEPPVKEPPVKEAPVKETPVKEAIPDEQQLEEDDSPELIPVVLQSGTYFWDPESNDLYEFISDEEAGEIVGLIKSVRIKNQIYYLDTTDNNFYEITNEKHIGQHLGQIVDRKAVFNKKL